MAEEIQYLAFYDHLTNLPNRRLLLDRLRQAWPPVTSLSTAAIRPCQYHYEMAQSLSLEVIAEEVETEEPRLFLLNSGCAHYQGFLFGKPVPIEQFEILLRQGHLFGKPGS